MPSSERQLVDAFMAAAGDALRGSDADGTFAALQDAAASLTETSRAQAEVLAGYAGLAEPTARQGASAVSGAGEQPGEESVAGKVASAVFGNVLGMAPLAKAVISLFGGGSEEQPPPLVKYAMPERLNLEGAVAGGVVTGSDYGQDGLPREQAAGYAGVVARAGESPQVTIQVQAMDSRSFLDHKDDIARAVREAMLNMHPLNDVVSEI